MKCSDRKIILIIDQNLAYTSDVVEDKKIQRIGDKVLAVGHTGNDLSKRTQDLY